VLKQQAMPVPAVIVPVCTMGMAKDSCCHPHQSSSGGHGFLTNGRRGWNPGGGGGEDVKPQPPPTHPVAQFSPEQRFPQLRPVQPKKSGSTPSTDPTRTAMVLAKKPHRTIMASCILVGVLQGVHCVWVQGCVFLCACVCVCACVRGSTGRLHFLLCARVCACVRGSTGRLHVLLGQRKSF
jgi:hypothetical protein